LPRATNPIVCIDDEQKKKLLDADGIVELCDASGRLLGKILPEKENLLEGWEPVAPPICEEEDPLERARYYDRGAQDAPPGTVVNYNIEWDLGILRDFTAYWEQLSKSQQRTVMDTLDDTDRMLKSNPWEVGESRHTDSFRVIISLPLVLTYQIDNRLNIVRVVDAKVYWKKKNQ